MSKSPQSSGRPVTRLVLIRHGETDWNLEGRYQGQSDPPLNAQGRRKAEALIPQLRPLGLCCLYSSLLQRAWETACILARGLGLPLFPEPRLAEINLGAWEGMRVEDIQNRDPEAFARWIQDPWHSRPPQGESPQEVWSRVWPAVQEIARRHVGETVGLVTHRVPIVLLQIHLQGAPKQAFHTLPVPNGGWTVLPLEVSL